MTIPFCLASNRHSILRIVPPARGHRMLCARSFSGTPPLPAKARRSGSGGKRRKHGANELSARGRKRTMRNRFRRRGKQSVWLSAAAFRAAFSALFGQKPGGKAAPTTSAQVRPLSI